MALQDTSLSNLRVNDPVITQIVHGYVQADSVADFLGPVVPVDVRAGKVIKFGREQFAVLDTRRAPGTDILQVGSTYGFDSFILNQHAAAGKVTQEEYEEAINGEAKVDLRANAAKRAAETIAQSWEAEVISEVTNAADYEASCQAVLSGTAQFSDPGSDPEATLIEWKEAVRSQIGIYPNSAVISADVFNALKLHPTFRDRVKYTSIASINLDMLATWFDLPGGIRVAQRVKYDPATKTQEDMFPAGTMLVFYRPEFAMTNASQTRATFMPVNGADKAVPSFAYTYQLRGYPIAQTERFEERNRSYYTDIIAEQRFVKTGLGANGLVGSGFLASDVV